MAEESAPVQPDQAQPASEGDGATEDFDLKSLLAEFDDPGDSNPQPATQEPDEATALKQRLEALEQQIQGQTVQQEISHAVSAIKANDALKDLSDDWIEDRLHGMARRDPAFQKAWENKHRNPDAWNSILAAKGEEIAKEMGSRPDPQLTSDREAAQAAAKSHSTEPVREGPSNEELNSMPLDKLMATARTMRK